MTDEVSFTAKRMVLAEVAERAATVVSGKDIYPLLSNFLVDVGDGVLRLIATDMELSVLASTRIVVTGGTGRVLIPARRFLTLLREAEEGDVGVEVRDGVAYISAGQYHGELKLRPPDEYPPLADIAGAQFSEVPRDKLLEAISYTRMAASRDGTSPRLMAIDVADGKVTAGSQVRLHQVALPGFPAELKVQIPIGAADDLVRLLRADEQPVIGVAEADFVLAFRINEDIFMAGKLPSDYPEDGKRRLGSAVLNATTEVKVNTADLRAAVRRVRVTADEGTSAIGLRLSKGKVTVISRDQYGNCSEETVACDWSKSGERLVVVNHDFLVDLLGLAAGPVATFMLGPDSGRKRSMLVLRDEAAGTTGAIGQLPAQLVGYE